MSSGQLHHFSQHLDEPLEGCGPSIRPAWEWLIQHHASVLLLDRYRCIKKKDKLLPMSPFYQSYHLSISIIYVHLQKHEGPA